jgi:hypothetical protein
MEQERIAAAAARPIPGAEAIPRQCRATPRPARCGRSSWLPLTHGKFYEIFSRTRRRFFLDKERD